MQINIPELLEKGKKEAMNIIDIRDNYQYNLGHIDDSQNIPTNYLLTNPAQYLNKKDIYYIYCEYGNTSRYVVNQLNRLGYKTISIAGGYSTYQKMKQ